MGKTGLIKHLYFNLSQNTDYQLIYLDIYRTKNVQDFVNELANAMLSIQKKQWYQKAFDLIKSLRPVITINPVTGSMEAEIKAVNSEQSLSNLDVIFNFFEKFSTKVIIAIDEFQQITEYPESGFEALLRSKIQFLNNVNFIYSGSNRRIISSMFNDYNRPFYQSCNTLYLEKISFDVYTTFISKLMLENGRKIDTSTVENGLKWTESYSWYTQNFFNRLWGKGVKTITESTLFDVEMDIFAEKERDFVELRNLLPVNQMNLLTAIAKENQVQKPNAIDFIKKHRLGSASSVNSALKVLENKEIIYFENGVYKVYDVFLTRFLQS